MAVKAKVLIYEPSLSGHRANFVSVHAEELLKLGADVWLAVPENALEQPEGNAFLSKVLPRTRHLPLSPFRDGLSVLAQANAKLSLLRESVSKCKPDHCFVPYADGVSQAWGMKAKPRSFLPQEMPIEGLVMRETYAYPRLGWKKSLAAKGSLHFQCRAPWTRLHHLDPLAFDVINRKKTNAEHFLIPDIIQRHEPADRNDAIERLGLDPGQCVVTCPGAVNYSKGSHSLIDAVTGMDESIGVQLVLIGKHSEKIKAKLKRLGQDSRIVSIDRFASVEEFDLLFSAADVIAVCYPKHFGSASVLLRAAAAGRKIIASDYGWIGWATDTFRLGETCDATSPDAIRKLIKGVALSKNKDNSGASSQGIRLLLDYHSRANHLAHWTSLYRQKQGLPQSESIVFDEVLRKANSGGDAG